MIYVVGALHQKLPRPPYPLIWLWVRPWL